MNVMNPDKRSSQNTIIPNENTQLPLPPDQVPLPPAPLPLVPNKKRTKEEEEEESEEEESEEEEESDKKTIRIKLINQGTYGCIYKPEIVCDTGEPGDIRYVSKIQKNTETIQNEISIGERVKQITNYSFFFSMIESTCPVSISKISQEEQQKCKLISKDNESKYISGKIRYISKMNIEDYFLELPREPELISKKLYASFSYILKSLQKLYEKGIIHYDIKEKNIMYDEHNHSPIIIDFGLSFVPTDATTAELQYNALYTNEFYPYWRFDIFVLSYITCSVRKDSTNKELTSGTSQEPPPEPNVTEDEIDKLVNSFMKEFIDFNQTYSEPLTETETNTMKSNYKEMLAKYIGKNWEDVFKDFFTPEFYSTWDVYATSITFLIICKSIKVTTFENPTITKMIELWKSIICAIPNQCKSIEALLKEIDTM
jgi:Protein kinase domain